MIIMNAPVEVGDDVLRPTYVSGGIDMLRLLNALEHAGFDLALRVDGKVVIVPAKGLERTH